MSTQWRKRLSILARDSWRCVYCDADLTTRRVTIDHLVPRSRGGSNALHNLAAACGPCNQAKGDKTLAEFGREDVLAVIAARPCPLVEGPPPVPCSPPERNRKRAAWPDGPRNPFVAKQVLVQRAHAAADHAAYLREVRALHDLR